MWTEARTAGLKGRRRILAIMLLLYWWPLLCRRLRGEVLDGVIFVRGLVLLLFVLLRTAWIGGRLHTQWASNRRLDGFEVVPFGKIDMILFISSSKPISKIRSASSITSALRFRKTKPLVFSRWSSKRPGVATIRFTPLTSLSTSALLFAPPITIPNVWEWCAMRSFATPKICNASSRVGDTITIPVPVIHENKLCSTLDGAGLSYHSVAWTSFDVIIPQPVSKMPMSSQIRSSLPREHLFPLEVGV